MKFFGVVACCILIIVVFSVIGCGGFLSQEELGDITFVNVSSTIITIKMEGHVPFQLSTHGGTKKITIGAKTIEWSFSPSVHFEESANGKNLYYIFFDY